jgi:hypothetical protein
VPQQFSKVELLSCFLARINPFFISMKVHFFSRSETKS